MSPGTQFGGVDELVPHSLRDLLTVVFKRRWLILTVLVTVVAVVMILGLIQPRTYNVVATLLVHGARAEMPLAPTDSTQVVVNRVSEADLNTEIEVLKSRKLIEDVVRTLTAATTPQPDTPESVRGESTAATAGGPNQVRDSKLDNLVLYVQGALDVSAVKKSNILQISYSSTDPAWATEVVSALVDEYLKQRIERYQSPQAVQFFEQQMNEAEQRLTQHEQALEDFVDASSITMVEGADGADALAAQKGLVMQRLSGLETDLGREEVELESQRRQVESLRAMMQQEPERLEDPRNQDATSDEIERALASLKLQRDALLQDYKPDSRHVRDIDTQIKMAEDRLRQARGASSVSGTEANPLYVQLKSELLHAEASLQGTQARVVSLRSQVAEYRKELDKLNDTTFDLENLTRNARAAEDDYLLYRKKHEEARISAAMDQEKFINVTVAQPAQMPFKPEPRNLSVRLFLSVMLGLLGGVGLAFALEMFFDRSFTTAGDIEKKLGIPHIASIPDGEAVGF